MKRILIALLLSASFAPALLMANPSADSRTAGGSASQTTPLVYGVTDLNGLFTPFFYTSVYDGEIADFVVGDSLLRGDRVGDLVYKGIQGETRNYNGTNYTYNGIADVTVTRNERANTTVYNFKLRQGVRFSDGQEMDADDVIFTFYVFCDPSYTGLATINSLEIQGLNAYRTKTSDEVYTRYQTIAQAILAAGQGRTGAGAGYTADQYTGFYNLYTQSWKNYAQKIVDYVVNNYAANAKDLPDTDLTKAGVKVALGMMVWGFGDVDNSGNFVGAVTGKSWNMRSAYPTIDDYYNELSAAYNGSLEAFAEVELVNDSDDPVQDAVNAFVSQYGKNDPSMRGVSIDSISGIKKLGKYEVEVTLNGLNAAAIYRLAVTPAPLHYYGNEAQYNYERNQFGFPFGDLSIVHAKDSAPMGAGPYKFLKYENRVVYLEANPYYWRGEPKIKTMQYKITTEPDRVPGIITGSIDLAEVSISKERAVEVSGYNSNKQLSGNVLTYVGVDNLGYGYIGLNANNIKVGNDPTSTASKNLRKGLATVLAAYRSLTVDSYYGETAAVINYPISNTSWAAPRPTDSAYRVAYSKDVNGRDIYTASMSADQRYAAASKAALGFLQAAGYTLSADGSRVIAAPAGASLQYDAAIGTGGNDDHPSWLLLTKAREAFAGIGISLNINTPDWSVLSSAMSAGTTVIWVAAWSASLDPDMYQVYHSSNVIGKGSSSNLYNIADPQLDRYIEAARASLDNAYRKEIFRSALEVILDWGVEVPVYQRQNCTIISTTRVNINTLPKDITTYWGWAAEIEKLELN
ncbi:MAG: ABC transporter substrate-binding protein [Treponema sp.]|jgi:peptide/nickel transport system substrate-binding protein|nr:ABC transporter substrate-binding protein [Treponema sp.]